MNESRSEIHDVRAGYSVTNQQEELQSIRIGDFIVDFIEKIAIAPNDEKKNLSPSTIKLINLFLLNKGQFVSADQIQDEIYGSQCVDDSSIRKQVTVLRKVFDDNAKEKIYIENKLGHGYRLIADIQPIQTSGFMPVIKQWDIKKSIIFILFTLLLIITATLVFQLEKSVEYIKINTGSEIKPFSHLKGQELFPWLSYDKKWLLFTNKVFESKTIEIFVKDMEKGDLIQLTSGEGYNTEGMWANDGHNLIYTNITNTECKFVLAKFDSNTRQLTKLNEYKLCEKSAISSKASLWGNEQGLYFTTKKQIGGQYIIYSYSFETNESWPITSPSPTGQGDYSFTLSGDGRKLVFLRNNSRFHTEIWIYDTLTKDTRLIETVNIKLHTVSWDDHQNSLIFKNAENAVVKLNIEDGKREKIAQLSFPFYSPILIDASSNALLIVKGNTVGGDIVKYSIRDKVHNTEISSSHRDKLPFVSKDGKKIAWISNRTGINQIWINDESGKPRPVSRITAQLNFSSVGFSSDGKFIGGTASGRWFVCDLSNNEIYWSEKDTYYENFQWGRDPTVAYISKRNNEQWEIYTLDLKTKVLSHSKKYLGFHLVLESQKNEITYVSRYKKKGFWRISGDKHSTFIELKESIERTNYWADSSDGIYYISGETLYFLDKDSEIPIVIEEDFAGWGISKPFEPDWILAYYPTREDTDIYKVW